MGCCGHHRTDFAFNFGSAIITIVIGALAFITALAWNELATSSFERYCDSKEELDAKLTYAVLATAIAILLGFFLMHFVDGTKW